MIYSGEINYEKKYKDALERAKKIDIDEAYASQGTIAKTIFPELAESEDERIRKGLIEALKTSKTVGELKFTLPEPTREECITYLEKQKEQKHPNGCFTCDEYKKGYEEGRRNGFTAGYNKAMKEVEQKEQKPNIELIQRSWYMEGYHDREFGKEPKWIIKTGEGGPKHELNPRYGQPLTEQHPSSKFHPGDWVVYDGPLGHAILQVEDVLEGRYTFVDNDSTLLEKDSDKFLRPLTPKDVEKPAEWSEEDVDMLNSCISSIEEAKENRYAYKETDGDTSYDHEIAWLKSLRCHWKPNDEDEVRLINTTISFLKDFADKGYENAVECIDWLKSKLNGNTCE